MGSDHPIRAAELETPGQTVGHEEAVERIAGPIDRDRRVDQHRQGNVINDESRVNGEGLGQGDPVHLEPTDLVKELDFEQRDRGDRPWPPIGEPRVLLETWGFDDQPEKEVGIEQHLKPSAPWV